jgi:hypothetical protein
MIAAPEENKQEWSLCFRAAFSCGEIIRKSLMAHVAKK